MGEAGDVGHSTGKERGGLVLELDISNEGRIDHLVNRLGLPLSLKLELLLVAKSIHCRGPTVRIIANKVPTSGNMRLFMVTFLSKERRRHLRATLWRSASAPLPITFPELEPRRDAEVPTVVVGLDRMGHDDFTSEVRARLRGLGIVEFAHGGGAVVVAELVDHGGNGHGVFAVEDARPIAAIDVDVVLTGAGVVAVDDVVEVLVDDHRRGAEDDEVVVELGDGVVEVGFLEDG